MIVMALMGLFFAATSYLSRDPRIYQSNAERLANSIYDTIRNARNNMIIGRGVLSGSTMVVTNERTITVSSTGITSSYLYGMSGTGTEESFPSPFYDNDAQYIISDIAVSSGGMLNGLVPSWDHTGATIASIIVKPNSDITITAIKGGTPIVSTIRTLKLTASYAGFEQSVVIDRVTGTIEIKKSSED